mmetsp:Transcript_12481/g.18727  ORF Transcript_12481/g.18727 Transcript_12481/m.18727 type:complete len:300 (+) Transcript_12481:151-1050(+)
MVMESMSIVRSSRPLNPPEFLIKLKQMIEDEDPTLIRWNGGKIYINDPLALEKKMSEYFRHSNFSSFQRQLNNFGFRKVEGKGRFAACMYMHEELQDQALESILGVRRKVPVPSGDRSSQKGKKSAKRSTFIKDALKKRQRRNEVSVEDFFVQDNVRIPTHTLSFTRQALAPSPVPSRSSELIRAHSLDDIMSSVLPHEGDILDVNNNSDFLLSFLEKETASMPHQSMSSTSPLFPDPIFDKEKDHIAHVTADDRSSIEENCGEITKISNNSRVSIFGKTHHLKKGLRDSQKKKIVGSC